MISDRLLISDDNLPEEARLIADEAPAEQRALTFGVLSKMGRSR